MTPEPQQNKFTAEIIVFSIVAMVCMNSAYHLLAKPMASRSPSSKQSPSAIRTETAHSGRSPDSQSMFEQHQVKCEHPALITTKASKIRLTGNFCGRPQLATKLGSEAPEFVPLLSSKILNATTQYNATVFLDSATGKWSTDFIQLDSGSNQIKILFVYENKRSVPLELTVERQELISAKN